jgi:nuclear transport factor 2 (NTF2) superfamily protein
MIPCICINDSDKPKEIPQDKWPKKGDEYHVIYTIWSVTSNTLGFYLYELELNESCSPYEMYKSDRFAFTRENLDKLMELIKDCNDTALSVNEVLEQVKVQDGVSAED